MRLTFVHLSAFVADAKRLGLNDEDIRTLELLLLQNPTSGAVIPGTGGVRKVRFAPPSWHTGKSGASRVIYAYFVRSSHVYLLLAYGKNEQANLTAEEKRACREMMLQISKLQE